MKKLLFYEIKNFEQTTSCDLTNDPVVYEIIVNTHRNINQMTWTLFCRWYQLGRSDQELSQIFGISIQKVEARRLAARYEILSK